MSKAGIAEPKGKAFDIVSKQPSKLALRHLGVDCQEPWAGRVWFGGPDSSGCIIQHTALIWAALLLFVAHHQPEGRTLQP